MSQTATLPVPSPGWLRTRNFDMTFVQGLALLALASGALVVAIPRLFVPILLVDLWLLGYHHVISTFTRISFDRKSAREHRFLAFYLPPLVLGATFALAWGVGAWTVSSLYLYWQWFHYTRQSWGINRVYQAKSGGLATDSARFSKLTFYLVPTWGILYRSWQAPAEFLFTPLQVIPVPGWLVDAVGVAALVSVLIWGARRWSDWRAGRLAIAQTYYLLSHYAVFTVGYWLITDITFGWLVINVWHNAQYIMFVWLFNTNRFKGGVDKDASFLSYISQPDRKHLYFLTCFGISTVFYLAVGAAITGQQWGGIAAVLIVYQAVNFHHYIVDGFIWKVRRKPMRKTFDLDRA